VFFLPALYPYILLYTLFWILWPCVPDLLLCGVSHKPVCKSPLHSHHVRTSFQVNWWKSGSGKTLAEVSRKFGGIKWREKIFLTRWNFWCQVWQVLSKLPCKVQLGLVPEQDIGLLPTLWRNAGSHHPVDMAPHSKRSVCLLRIHESSSWNTRSSTSCGTVHDLYCFP